jgi:streptogramin lyase
MSYSRFSLKKETALLTLLSLLASLFAPLGQIVYAWTPTVTINYVDRNPELPPYVWADILYKAVFSEPIDPTTFTTGAIAPQVPIPPGLMIKSVTETGAHDGTEFDIIVSSPTIGTITLEIPAGTNPSSTIASTDPSPMSIAIGSGDTLYVASYDSGTVTRIKKDWTTDRFWTWWTPTGAGPHAIAVNSLWEIYTANSIDNNISMIDPTTGDVTDIWVVTGANPIDIMIDKDDNIYTANFLSGTITKFDYTTGITSHSWTTGAGPQAIAMNSLWDIFVANFLSDTVTKFDHITGEATHFWNTGNNPIAITIDSNDNIYTANHGSNTVTKFTSGGTITTFSPTGGFPYDITVDSLWNVYTANQDGNVTKFTPSGTATIIGTTGVDPNWLVLDSEGNIFTVNQVDATVTKIVQGQSILGVDGTPSAASTSTTNSVALIDPSPTVTLSTTGVLFSWAFTVMAEFSEPVIGIDSSDFVVSSTPTDAGLTKSSVTPLSSTGYTITVTPSNSTGTITLGMLTGAAQDSGENDSDQAVELNVTYDKEVPILTGSVDDVNIKYVEWRYVTNKSLYLTYIFSENVALNFSFGSDPTMTEEAFSGSTTYTFLKNFGTEGNHDILTGSIAWTDLAGNVSVNNTILQFLYDITPPALSETTPVTTPTTVTTPTYIFTSSETGSITYGGSCSGATTVANSWSNTITLSGADGQPFIVWTYEGCTITVTDDATNSGTLTISSFTVEAEDTTPPTLISLTYSPDPAMTGVVLVTAEYSESVTVPTITIDQSGSASTTSGMTVTEGSNGTIYTYEYTVNADNGVEYIDGIATGSLSIVNDLAGNPIVYTDPWTTFVIDTTPPILNITSPLTTTAVNTGAIIAFTNNEDQSANPIGECSIDEITWTPCTSGESTLSGVTGFDIMTDGTFTLFVRDLDVAGNTSTTSEIDIIKDSLAPTLSHDDVAFPFPTITSDDTPSYTIHSTQTGTIDYNGGSCTSDTVTANMGDTEITFNTLIPWEYNDCKITVTDDAGNISNMLEIGTFTINEPAGDSIEPVVTLIGSGTVTIELGSWYIDSGAVWTDNVDGIGTGYQLSDGTQVGYSGELEAGLPEAFTFISTLNIGAVGEYNIVYTKVDAAGNQAFTSRTVIVQDTTEPNVELVGSGEVTIMLWDSYSDLGVIWTDASVVGEQTEVTYISGSVDDTILWTYTLEYFVFDGYNTGSAIRTIHVDDVPAWPDTTAPTISESVAVPLYTSGTYLQYTFISSETGSILLSGDCSWATMTANSWSNTITLSGANGWGFEDGTYGNCEITVSDYASPANQSLVLTMSQFTVDNVAPEVLFLWYSSDPANFGSVTVTAEYSESVTTAPSITIDQSGSALTTSGMTVTEGSNGTIYTYEYAVNEADWSTYIDGIATGSLSDVYDLAGNKAINLPYWTTFVIDTTPPEITQKTPVPWITSDVFPEYTFHSTESGTLLFTGPCSSANTVAIAWDNTITLSGALGWGFDNGVTIDTCSVTVTDIATNESNVLVVNSFTIDTSAPPTVTLTTTAPTTLSWAFTVSAEFSKPVTEVYATGFVIVNGTGTEFTSLSPTNYTILVTPESEGNVTVDMEIGAGKDEALNDSTKAIQLIRKYDSIKPVISQVTAVATPTSDTTPTYIFSSTETGSITYAGDCTGTLFGAIPGDNTVTLSNSLGTPFSSGTYNDCRIQVTDEAYNVSDILTTSGFTIDTTVADTTAPILFLSGFDPTYIEFGSSFVDSGARWTDGPSASGDILDYNSGTLNTGSLGTWTIGYYYVDAGGNTGSISRLVVVRDTVAPLVNLEGEKDVYITLEDPSYTTGDPANIDPGVSWTDAHKGVWTEFILSGSVENLATWDYILEYLVVDASGNTGSVTRTVHVTIDWLPPADEESPIVTLSGSDTIYVELGTAFIDPGANWTDNVDGIGTGYQLSDGTQVGYSGELEAGSAGSFTFFSNLDPGVIGEYNIVYTKVDNAANAGFTGRTVIVQDTTEPNVELVGSGEVTIILWDSYSDQGVIWTDASVVGEQTEVTYISGSVDDTILWTYTLEYFVFDGYNTGSAIRTIYVTSDWVPPADTTPPTVAGITFSDVILNSGETAVVTIVLSEVASGATFSSADVTVQNGTLSTLTTADNITWTGTFTPTASVVDATNVATVGTGWRDVANNLATVGATSVNYTVDTTVADTTPPTVAAITFSDVILNSGETAVVTIVLSEIASGATFSSADVTVQNGTLSTLTTADNITWTGTFTPTASVVDATNVATVGTGWRDVANNLATVGATSVNYTVDTTVADTTPPTVAAITFSDVILNSGETAVVTIVLSEIASGATFSSADVTVQNGTLSTLTTADNITWTGTFTPTASVVDATNVATVGTGWRDVANNLATVGATSVNYTVDTTVADTTPPTVAAITFSDVILNSGETAVVTIVLSEIASGATFSSADVTVQNGTLSTLTTADNITWTGTFTPTASVVDATNVATVGTGWRDVANNLATVGATSVNYTVDTTVADTTPPTVAAITFSDVILNSGETAVVTIVLSEIASGATFSSADVTVQNGTLSTLTTADNITWTGTFTPTASVVDATNVATVGTGWRDVANNLATVGATSVNYTVDTTVADTTPPTVAAITFSDVILNSGETAVVTIVLSEIASGATFSSADVTVQNGTLSTLTTADNITWTGTFTPTASVVDATNVATVGTGWRDVANNLATVGATSVNYTVDTTVADTTPPTVAAITFSDVILNSGETAVVTIVLSEIASGATFSSADVTVQNGTLSTLTTADNITWTGTFTPTASVVDATNVATVGTGWRDVANNLATVGATSVNYTVDTTVADTTPPTVTIDGSISIIVDADGYMIRGQVIWWGTTVSMSGWSSGTIITPLTGTYFSAFIALKQDNVNSIVISATDNSGNTGTGGITIVESSAVDAYRSPITISWWTLSWVSIVTGNDITNTTRVTLGAPVIFTSGSAVTTIPSWTQITNNLWTSFNATNMNIGVVAVTSGLASTESSNGAIDFGTSGVGLLFSKPIRVEIPVPSYPNATVSIRVRHAGSTTFGTTWLTNNPTATCAGWVASIPSDIAPVTNGIATIYSCAASTFVAVTTTTVTTPTEPTTQYTMQGAGWPSNFYMYATSSAWWMELWLTGLQRMLNNSVLWQRVINPIVYTINENRVNVKDIYRSSSKAKLVELIKNGFIKNNALFHPNRKMKRYEFVKIVSLVGGFTNDFKSDIHFSDVQRRSTAERYIAFAAEMGWIDSESDTFRPNEAITLGEAQEILDTIKWEYSLGDEDTNWDSLITKEVWAIMIYNQLQH